MVPQSAPFKKQEKEELLHAWQNAEPCSTVH